MKHPLLPLRTRRFVPLRAGLILSTLLAAWLAAPARASEDDVVRTDTLRIAFSTRGAGIRSWTACNPSCEQPSAQTGWRGSELRGPVALVAPGDADLTRRLRKLEYRLLRESQDGQQTLRFVSEPLAPGVSVETSYRIPRNGGPLAVAVELRGQRAHAFGSEHPIGLEIAAGASLKTPAEASQSAHSEPAELVSLGDGSVHPLAARPSLQPIAAMHWSGARTRFWACLARSPEPIDLLTSPSGALQFVGHSASPLRLDVYYGALGPGQLRSADPALMHLLFASLWFWMRWLCLGMLWVLEILHAAVGNAGLAILLLSGVVKIALRPLTRLAERWQAQVDAERARLAPELRQIRAESRGEEQSRRLLELFRRHEISPFHGLKSALGLGIQIPIFFGAYHTLDEAALLQGQSFLWISDLSQADQLATLPFSIPLLGNGVNGLPFLMLAITLLASRCHRPQVVDARALRSQRASLYGMAVAFFLLLYQFPAGMVLYWTTNGATQLVRELWSRRRTTNSSIASNGVEPHAAIESR